MVTSIHTLSLTAQGRYRA